MGGVCLEEIKTVEGQGCRVTKIFRAAKSDPTLEAPRNGVENVAMCALARIFKIDKFMFIHEYIYMDLSREALSNAIHGHCYTIAPAKCH